MRDAPRAVFMERAMLSADHAQRMFVRACDALTVSTEAIQSARRDQFMVERRWLIMQVLRARHARLDDIGELVHRDRATVIYGLRAVKKRLHGDIGDSWERLLLRAQRMSDADQ